MKNTFFFLLDSLETPTFVAHSKTHITKSVLFHSCRAKNNFFTFFESFLNDLTKIDDFSLVDLNMAAIFDTLENKNVIFWNLVR